jgi:hypothetical protein
MKIKIIALSFIVSLNMLMNAQLATKAESEEIPESGSVSYANIFNPNFNNSFVFNMTHGATIFNQTDDIFLIDSKTLEVKKKILYPKFKGYSSGRFLEFNNFFSVIFTNKKDDFFVTKTNEDFVLPETPDFLFSAKNYSDFLTTTNEKHDLCVMSYEIGYKKMNKTMFYYRVYNNEFKLLLSDSSASDYKKPDTLKTYPYDNGIAVIKNNGSRKNVFLRDVKLNKTYSFDISNGNTIMTVSDIKSISNDRIVLLGKYDNNSSNGGVSKYGVFKIVYNQKTNTIDEQTYFDHLVGDKLNNSDKNIESTIITETGDCYVLISQTMNVYVDVMVPEIRVIRNPNEISQKVSFHNNAELIYLKSDSEKWIKALPITPEAIGTSRLSYINGTIALVYLDYEGENNKIDYNNYVFGKPYPSTPMTLKQTYKSNMSLLKINSSGFIQHQSFNDFYYLSIKQIGNEFIGVTQGLNGPVTSKCKLFKLKFNDK